MSERILIAENRCAALFVSTCHRTLKAVWAPGVDRATVHPREYMDKAPISRVVFSAEPPIVSRFGENIRLSSDVAAR